MEFIPLAEECGLIIPLGERVTERAFQQFAAAGYGQDTDSKIGLSINLARQQLLLPDLTCRLLLAADRAGIDPSIVHLEITEGAVMADVETALETLRQLQQAGFRLAIDDFGTGYSSLACLHQFPLDLLKLDRAFLEGLGGSSDRAAIVRTITSLAGILHFRVVAEGIETPEQLEMVRELGCDYGQGYYFLRPVPIEELPDQIHLPNTPRLARRIPC